MTQFRPTRFEVLPNITKNIIIINVLVFAAQELLGDKLFNFSNILALHSLKSDLFRPWQFISHMFMHANVGHVFSNMLAVYFFGSRLENVWGAKKYLTFYIICGIGAALCHLIALHIEQTKMFADALIAIDPESLKHFLNKYATNLSYSEGTPPIEMANYLVNQATVGASGAVFGILAAFAYLFPNTEVYFYFMIPIKAKWFVIGYAILELTLTFQNSAGDNVAHIAHLGGALFGFLLVYFWNKTNRNHFY